MREFPARAAELGLSLYYRAKAAQMNACKDSKVNQTSLAVRSIEQKVYRIRKAGIKTIIYGD